MGDICPTWWNKPLQLMLQMVKDMVSFPSVSKLHQ